MEIHLQACRVGPLIVFWIFMIALILLMHTHVFICMYACAYICVCACMCVCMFCNTHPPMTDCKVLTMSDRRLVDALVRLEA